MENVFSPFLIITLKMKYWQLGDLRRQTPRKKALSDNYACYSLPKSEEYELMCTLISSSDAKIIPKLVDL